MYRSSKDLQIFTSSKTLIQLEDQVTKLQKQLDEFFMIKGQISAKVENGLFISAEIDLKENNSSLDTSKSKFIFSTSGEKTLGSEAYEKGEPVTSLHMKIFSYQCNPSTYFVRCIVYNSNGKSNEIVSNPVTTSGSCLTFDYEGKPAKISLPQGKYKLEVWGAKGGNSTGNGFQDGDYNRHKQSSVEGGLGGYSRGILNLRKNETVYVYVGGKGQTADSSDGSCTKGGFPDGGGTKTGNWDTSYLTVPGTGGGGGGWYGGGGGGYGNFAWCSSGGGGSGWTFTESSFKTWKSGDSENASKFTLDGSYYLTDEVCLGGNEEFPRPDGKGTEHGHVGNGYAKITPL